MSTQEPVAACEAAKQARQALAQTKDRWPEVSRMVASLRRITTPAPQPARKARPV